MTVNKVTLHNGVEMPQEGFGVFQIDGFDNAKNAVKNALDAGYRAIDTAEVYKNEEAVGQGIKESNVDRSDIFLTTKVFSVNFDYEKTKKAIKGSLRKLQTDYLDLVITHTPFGNYYSAYHALEDLYREGVIRAIGVSNLVADRFVDLANFADIIPMVDQVETHIFNQQKELKKYADKYGTFIEAWAPFAEGNNNLFTNETLKKIGDNYDKSPAQVALRFLIQKNIIVIPKSTHKDRMEQNLAVWDFELSEDEMKQITDMDKNQSAMGGDFTNPAIAEEFIKQIKNGNNN